MFRYLTPLQSLVSVSGVLPGADRDSLHPTILVVAHYDSAGAAPSLSAGADSNGSGVAVLLELARCCTVLTVLNH